MTRARALCVPALWKGIALEPRGRGLLGITLHYPYEIRDEQAYFDEIPNEKIPKDMLEMAQHIVGQKTGHFEPQKFEDQYEDALEKLLQKKSKGEAIEAPKERRPSNVINLMDALGESVAAEGGGGGRKPAAASRRTAAHGRRSASKRAHARRKAG
jgi:Ku protein